VEVGELARDAQEGGAAVERPVHEHDSGGSGGPGVLSHEEVGHGGAR
jgi:hypothetical protein